MHTRTALKLFALTAATLAAYGCSGLDLSEGSSSATSNLNGGFAKATNDGTDARGFQADGQSFGNLTTARKTSVAVPAALRIAPVNGQLFPNVKTRGLSVHFQGFTATAGQTVDVQVLATPGAAISEASWVTIGSASASTTGTSFNDTAQIFAWSLDAIPNTDGTKWDQGGILRYRTVAVDANGAKTALPFWDIGAGDCIAAQGAKSWKDVVKTCKSAFSPNLGDAVSSATTAATLLSPTPQPRDDFRPNYLSRRGEISTFETDDYYDQIDAPRSLDQFARRFGFIDSQRDGFFDASQDGQEVASGLYYNLGDLGLGREIHCKQFTTEDGQPGTACITKNYGVDGENQPDFSGDAESAMDDAIRNQNSFAAVCMVKIGNTFGPTAGNDVQFMVYGADGNIVDQAQLDSTGSNESIPEQLPQLPRRHVRPRFPHRRRRVVPSVRSGELPLRGPQRLLVRVAGRHLPPAQRDGEGLRRAAGHGGSSSTASTATKPRWQARRRTSNGFRPAGRAATRPRPSTTKPTSTTAARAIPRRSATSRS